MNQQIITILDGMWQDFETLFLGGAQPAHWRQEEYRAEFFKAFASIYQIQAMYGDEVEDFLTERHLRRDDPRREEKLQELSQICDAWSEWKYAWDNYTEPQQE